MTVKLVRGYTFGATELVTNTKLHQMIDNASYSSSSSRSSSSSSRSSSSSSLSSSSSCRSSSSSASA